jgi:hypothetical protein
VEAGCRGGHGSPRAVAPNVRMEGCPHLTGNTYGPHRPVQDSFTFTLSCDMSHVLLLLCSS